ncbi:MAG: prepilin-type N-terminal cleavage/methylation domain-containing protein, partial [Desulfobacterales bacterium]|nr:prepilin-type N-terminal cleavage/methylation domain-containing protein [Desulfobacterales bacterium]
METILKRSGGFTLIEIMITLLVSSVVMIALYQTFSSQQKSYMVQENRVEMQQGLRGALIVMTGDIRMAGFDKMRTGNFGITDIRPRDIDDDVETGATGYSSLEVTIDWDEDGAVRAGGAGLSERIKYSIYDFIAGDNAVDLARNSDPANVGSRRVLAENIRAFGLAFAFDDDLDGRIDTYDPVGTAVPPANQPVIWAIDSDGDNILDTNLDTNMDGVINVNDSPGGPGSNGIDRATE